MEEGLGRLVEIPLQVTAKPRAVVENAEQLRFLPLSAGGQDGPGPLVKVQVPKAVDVSHFVGARLAHRERIAVGVLAMATFAGSQKPVLFHKAADRHIHRTRALGALSSLAISLRAANDASPQRYEATYAGWKNAGSAIFCANRMTRCGYITPLTKRDASGQLAVVIGASQAKSLAMGAGPSPTSRSRSETGSCRRLGAGTRRADKSTNGPLFANGPRHQRSHRRVVRAGTPVVRTPAPTVATASATALASTTTAPTYTRRPRNRTDGGVARDGGTHRDRNTG